MEIRKVTYSDSNPVEIRRWIEHLIEVVLSEEMGLSSMDEMKLKTSKYLEDNALNHNPERPGQIHNDDPNHG
ncbi:hypothetical protein [Alicyclobacillus mengziensis]|uniref:Uncharacterized protein n=1 Tax=Alicyclobacillus mengziensis TaxID=2931921 RepID=A0A9X7Z6U4_9BACL|nr:MULTISPECIES: hypothetical protein [Alicyclobacillus]MCF8566220.1 hypothetical protein [Alicyclobacillus tolerans]QSO46756.1 hypothetical protein JZ786_20310 [Alicyclobacillus mengziensis]